MILQYAVGGALFPFLTLLLRDRGMTVPQISTALLCGAASMLVAPFFWGMLADRFIPLNRLFVVMNVAAVIALGAFAFQHAYAPMVISLTLFYASFMPTPILTNAIALQHLPDPQRQFGPVRAWGSAGWVLPSFPIFVWLSLSRSQDLGFLLGVTMTLGVIMAVTALWLPHTPPGALAPRQAGSEAPTTYWPSLRRLLRNVNYLILIGAYLLMAASFVIQAFYSPVRLEDLGMTRPWIGLVQSVGVLWEIALFFARSAIVNRLGVTGSIVAGCVALLVRQLLFAYADNLWVLAASYLLVGTTVVLFHIGVNLLVAAMAEREVKSTAQTILTLCSSGIGPILANAVVGRLTAGSASDLSGVFLFGAILTAGAGALLLLHRGKSFRS
jgi:predicted MFS family arabinose efflux permease